MRIFDDGSSSYLGGHNAFVTNYDRLHPPSASDIVLTNVPDYQTGPLGDYYYPTNGYNLFRLLNAGTTNADLLGLYHYTLTTNQVKETNSLVDIGWHPVAVNPTNLAPWDTDAGGVPDYLEDANGSGSNDLGESDWHPGHASDDYDYLLTPGYLRCE